MRRSLLVGLLLSATLGAQTYRPWIETRILSRCDSVVAGAITSKTTLPNGDRLIRFAVDDLIHGREPEKLLLVGTEKQFTSFPDLRKILFLKNTARASMRVVLDWVDLPEDVSAARIDFLRRTIDICSEKDAGRKRLRMRDHVLAYAPSRSVWVRRAVIRELARLCESWPSTFDGGALLRLRRIPTKGLAPDDIRKLRESLGLVEAANAVGWIGAKGLFRDEKTKNAFLRELARYQKSKDPKIKRAFLDNTLKAFGRRAAPLLVEALRDDLPTIRTHAATTLGEMEAVAAARDLLKLATGDLNADVRRASVRAVGCIATPRAVPALMKIVDTDAAVRREALTALASINTGDAVLFLRDYDKRLRADPDSPAELRWHLTYLLGPDFPRDLATQQMKRRDKFRNK